MSGAHDHDSHSHGHAGHSHGVSADADRGKLAIALALALLLGFMAFEVVVGVIALSLVAIRLAAKPAKGAMTYGFKRAEILSCLLAAADRPRRVRRDNPRIGVGARGVQAGGPLPGAGWRNGRR